MYMQRSGVALESGHITPLEDRARRTVVVLVRTKWGVPVVLKNATDAKPFQFMFPQGGIAPGETVEAAALREVREELGLSASCIHQIERIEDSYFSPDARHGPKLLLPVVMWVGERCRIRLNTENRQWCFVRKLARLQQLMQHASFHKRRATERFVARADMPPVWGEVPRRGCWPQ